MDLGTREGPLTVDQLQVVNSLAVAVVTGGLDLFNGIGKFQEALGPVKEAASEISTEPVANNGTATVGNGAEGVDVFGMKKLDLVHNQAVDFGKMLGIEDGVVLQDNSSLLGELCARGNAFATEAGVNSGFGDGDSLALMEVKTSLEKRKKQGGEEESDCRQGW